MLDKETADAIGAWRYNIDPTSNGCEKYNHAHLSFNLPNLDLTIEGMVIWDSEISEYVFHFLGHYSRSRLFGTQRGFAMYDKDVREYITNTIGLQFGIFRTNGMYVIPEHASFFYDQTSRMVC